MPGLFCPGLQAPPLYLLFRPAVGAGCGGAHGAGVGSGLLGMFLGLSPKEFARPRGSGKKSQANWGQSVRDTSRVQSRELAQVMQQNKEREREKYD